MKDHSNATTTSNKKYPPLFSSTLKESPPSNGMIIPFTLAQKIKPYAQWTRDRCSPLNNFLEIIPNKYVVLKPMRAI